jgi:two-component system nitrogen regulation response regulator GlnG
LELASLRERVNEEESASLTSRLGPSEQIRRVVDQIGTVAASGVTTLIVGEPGTGKDRIARAIHRQSDLRTKPFLALDAGAIPEALIESDLFGHERSAFVPPDHRRSANSLLADGGTCYLDEVGNLPISLQGRLLRVLEARQGAAPNSPDPSKNDVRFVASTGVDLQARVAQGLFRADLYFRLAQYTIVLPPLRERPEDIPFLAQRFMHECAIELRRPMQSIDPMALSLLRNHPWKGNVRELRNTIRQAVVQSRDLVIQSTDIQAVLSGETQAPHHVSLQHSNGMSLRQAAEQAARSAEREIIVHALQATRGNKSQAAKALKTDYKTLHLKMKALKIRAHDFKNN